MPTDTVGRQLVGGVSGVLGTGERHEYPQPLGAYRVDPVDHGISLVGTVVPATPLVFRFLAYPVGGDRAAPECVVPLIDRIEIILQQGMYLFALRVRGRCRSQFDCRRPVRL